MGHVGLIISEVEKAQWISSRNQEGVKVGYGAIHMYDDLAWLLCFLDSDYMDMSQLQEPMSEDHDAHMVPLVEEVPKLLDGLQGEVIDTTYLCGLCLLNVIQGCLLCRDEANPGIMSCCHDTYPSRHYAGCSLYPDGLEHS